MDTTSILAQLRAEADRIGRAIAALEALSGAEIAAPPAPAVVRAAGRGPRRMSPAARRRISERMKARWAARRKTAAPARRISAAGRKRLSELARARWAERKKKGKNSL